MKRSIGVFIEYLSCVGPQDTGPEFIRMLEEPPVLLELPNSIVVSLIWLRARVLARHQAICYILQHLFALSLSL